VKNFLKAIKEERKLLEESVGLAERKLRELLEKEEDEELKEELLKFFSNAKFSIELCKLVIVYRLPSGKVKRAIRIRDILKNEEKSKKEVISEIILEDLLLHFPRSLPSRKSNNE